jgi:hypothetical protein
MNQAAIFGPFFACIALTLVVWVYMYVRRIHFLVSRNIDSKDMAVPGALAAITPPAVSNPSDNLKNLFEIPVLFYALTLYLFVTQQVMLRFCLYLAATIAVWFSALRAAAIHFGI